MLVTLGNDDGKTAREGEGCGREEGGGGGEGLGGEVTFV